MVQTYNVTVGGLAPGNEIYNVSVWFQIGRARQLGWFPYSLYSFASNRLPTPKGGLIAPVDGANFTLATGWVGRSAYPLCVTLSCNHVKRLCKVCNSCLIMVAPWLDTIVP